MSVLLLIRHGQASFGAEDYDLLSPAGERQSRILGAALAARGVRPDILVRGAMKRHRQTAEAAADGAAWRGEVAVDDGWNEFDHQQMFNLHPPDVEDGQEPTRAQFQQWFEAATSRWTSGDYAEEYDESFAAFGRRVDAALRRTVDLLAPKQTAVVFTSGGPITWVVCSLLGGGPEVWLQLNSVTVNASISKIVVGRRGATAVSFNEHSHIEAVDPALITYR